MRRATLLAATLASLITPAAAGAQNPWEPAATVEQGVARAVADAMPDLRYPFRLNWDAFGVRGGRDIFWHLAPPGSRSFNPPPPGMHRRTGWLNVAGRGGDVAVCGDEERIGGMAVSVSDIWLGRSDVIRELVDRDVTAVLVEERQSSLADPGSGALWLGDAYRAEVTRYPAYRLWRLARTGHEPANLIATYTCTPPGTRHATMCRMTWTVVFRPDDSLPELDACLTGARRHF